MRPQVVFGALFLAGLIGPTAVAAKSPPSSKPATATGPAVSCISLRNIRGTTVIDDRTIDFHVSGRKAYRNTLPFQCPQLGYNRAFGYATSQSQLCSVDIITVIIQGNPGLQGASCGLGRFTPIDRR